MTVYVQQEASGNLCHESALVYRQCILDATKCLAVDSSGFGAEQLADCDLFVGSVEAVTSVLAGLGVATPEPNYYPDQLAKYLGREVWKSDIKEVLTFVAAEQPVFAKSHNWKDITGQVFDGSTGSSLLLERDSRTPMWLSRTAEFISEWRAYVLNGSILAVCHYDGDENQKVDLDVIAEAAAEYHDSPVAYAFDWGLTRDGRTLLVECNDGWAIGAYEGIESKDYFALLTARWNELTDQLPAREVAE